MATATAPTTTGDESKTTESDAESGTPSEPTERVATEMQSTLPSDLIFGLLSVERRRRILTYLDENGGETTLSDVAEHIAAEENGLEVGQLSSDQRKRVYVGLYQCHLPKLDDADVVDYDRARGTIELRDEADQLFPHLYLDSPAAERDDSPEESEPSTRLGALRTGLADWIRG